MSRCDASPFVRLPVLPENVLQHLFHQGGTSNQATAVKLSRMNRSYVAARVQVLGYTAQEQNEAISGFLSEVYIAVYAAVCYLFFNCFLYYFMPGTSLKSVPSFPPEPRTRGPPPIRTIWTNPERHLMVISILNA